MPVHAALLTAVAVAVATTATSSAIPEVRAGDVAASRPVRWTPDELSTPLYESSPVFSPDGTELHFLRADTRFGGYRLLWSRCASGRWSDPAPPPFAAPAGTLEADPAFSHDGRLLYYVSARGNADSDDLDIWRVARDDDGRWGAPRRMPAPVNSPAAELLPRPLPGGRLLFGSSRPGGHGQGDIYIATPQDGGGWRLENAGPPISTSAYEYEAEISHDGKVMAVVADRGERSHLYLYDRDGDAWIERGRVPARDDVFQVGPLLSPTGDRLLFAQAEAGERSGEWFLVDLRPDPDPRWPPVCGEADRREPRKAEAIKASAAPLG
ncbi:TolB family protein [Luteimonas salinilitoris]|uniref:TolB family protein n=1 Tax=Luteimonas salinilitoris TaxID=3237697 RepID=A0ABV4HTJ3_9GAMM